MLQLDGTYVLDSILYSADVEVMIGFVSPLMKSIVERTQCLNQISLYDRPICAKTSLSRALNSASSFTNSSNYAKLSLGLGAQQELGFL